MFFKFVINFNLRKDSLINKKFSYKINGNA